MRTATVIQHVGFEDLGTLKEVLLKAGFGLNYLHAGYDDLSVLIHAQPPELLIILGGPISAYDEKRYSFILTELRIIESRVEKNLATIGICLGAQLIARAMGAKIMPGVQKEIEWSGLVLTDDARKSCFRHLEGIRVFHWHGDTFTLPENSILQASTEKYKHQAFLYKRILGIQFHPEVSARGLEKWFIGHANEIDANNISIETLRADAEKYADALQGRARLFLEEWLLSIN